MRRFIGALSIFAVGFLFFVHVAFAKTLEEFVAAEEGVEFGECHLAPKPNVDGDKISVVIPARWDNPHDRFTHSILLVGLSHENAVRGVLELRVAQELSPRETISVKCKDNSIKVKVSLEHTGRSKIFNYSWDGAKLHILAEQSDRSKK